MNELTRWAGLLLVVCIAVRAAAWLITPAIPLIAVSFIILFVFSRLFHRN